MTRQRHISHSGHTLAPLCLLPLRGCSSPINQFIDQGPCAGNLGCQWLWAVKSIENGTKGCFSSGSVNWGFRISVQSVGPEHSCPQALRCWAAPSLGLGVAFAASKGSSL